MPVTQSDVQRAAANAAMRIKWRNVRLRLPRKFLRFNWPTKAYQFVVPFGGAMHAYYLRSNGFLAYKSGSPVDIDTMDQRVRQAIVDELEQLPYPH